MSRSGGEDNAPLVQLEFFDAVTFSGGQTGAEIIGQRDDLSERVLVGVLKQLQMHMCARRNIAQVGGGAVKQNRGARQQDERGHLDQVIGNTAVGAILAGAEVGVAPGERGSLAMRGVGRREVARLDLIPREFFVTVVGAVWRRGSGERQCRN